MDAARIKHQLTIWVQYREESDEGVLSYSYQYSQPHELKEQRINFNISDAEKATRDALIDVKQSLVALHPSPDLVRLPHAKVAPAIDYGFCTIVVQDQKQAPEVPVCRLSYYEKIPEMPSQAEKEIRFTRTSMNADLFAKCQRASHLLKKWAWEHYKDRFHHSFID